MIFTVIYENDETGQRYVDLSEAKDAQLARDEISARDPGNDITVIAVIPGDLAKEIELDKATSGSCSCKVSFGKDREDYDGDYFEFRSRKELDAFLSGVEAAEGWLD